MYRNRVFAFLIMLCLLFGGCAGKNKNTIPIASVETRTPDQEGIDRSQMIENAPEYLINAQVPVTRNARINKNINKLITAQIDAFIANLPGQVEVYWGSSSLTIEYETHRFNDEIVTFIFEVYTYIAGAAHGMSQAITRTYNLRTGDAYRLSDIITVKQADYLAQLSERSIALLKSSGQLGELFDGEWVEEGASAAMENFARYAPLRQGLMIIFDPYQIGPYAIGEQRVVIPWEDLAGVSAAFTPTGAR